MVAPAFRWVASDKCFDKRCVLRGDDDVVLLNQVIKHHLRRVFVPPICTGPTWIQCMDKGLAEMHVHCAGNEHAIPDVTPRSMSEIMAEASNLDAFHVTVGNVEAGLRLLQVSGHSSGEVGHAFGKTTE